MPVVSIMRTIRASQFMIPDRQAKNRSSERKAQRHHYVQISNNFCPDSLKQDKKLTVCSTQPTNVAFHNNLASLPSQV